MTNNTNNGGEQQIWCHVGNQPKQPSTPSKQSLSMIKEGWAQILQTKPPKKLLSVVSCFWLIVCVASEQDKISVRVEK